VFLCACMWCMAALYACMHACVCNTMYVVCVCNNFVCICVCVTLRLCVCVCVCVYLYVFCEYVYAFDCKCVYGIMLCAYCVYHMYLCMLCATVCVCMHSSLWWSHHARYLTMLQRLRLKTLISLPYYYASETQMKDSFFMILLSWFIVSLTKVWLMMKAAAWIWVFILSLK
jgi:hypothetical protein